MERDAARFARGSHIIVPVDTNGEICFDTEAATYLLADINGWFAS